jgi:hypothetical protein
MSEEKKDTSGYVFVGCILIGVAMGMYFGKVAIGSILGVGVGFIMKYLIAPKSNSN